MNPESRYPDPEQDDVVTCRLYTYSVGCGGVGCGGEKSRRGEAEAPRDLVTAVVVSRETSLNKLHSPRRAAGMYIISLCTYNASAAVDILLLLLCVGTRDRNLRCYTVTYRERVPLASLRSI